MPYRMSFLLEDGGLNMGLKPLLAAILAFTNADNKRLNNAVEALRALDLEGVCCVRSASASAHGPVFRKVNRRLTFCSDGGLRNLPKLFRDGNVRCDGSSGRSAARLYRNPARHDAGQPGSVTAAPLQEAIGMWPVASGFAVERGEPSLPYPGR